MSLATAIKKLTAFSSEETIADLINNLCKVVLTERLAERLDPTTYEKLKTQLQLLLHRTDTKSKTTLGDAAGEALLALILINRVTRSTASGAFISPDELARKIAALDAKATRFSLKGINLSHISDDKLAALFAALPRGLQEVELIDNGLETRSTAGLIKVLGELPPKLKLLDLSGNGLNTRSLPEIEEIAFQLLHVVRIVFATQKPASPDRFFSAPPADISAKHGLEEGYVFV